MASTRETVLAVPFISLTALLFGCASDSDEDAQHTVDTSDTSTTAAPAVSPGTTPSGSAEPTTTANSTQTMATTTSTQGVPSTEGSDSDETTDATATGETSSDTNTTVSTESTDANTGEPSNTNGMSDDGAPSAGNPDAAAASNGQDAGAGGADDSQTGGADGTDSGLLSNCVGNAWPSADPTSAGPFQVAADKGVGPLAGVVPDPIYGDQQQRYNVYRPANLGQSGYCHPILIWANGFRDNPEQKPPDCIVDSNADRWCGQYLPLMNHLASHGFVVVASLSTATAEGDPLPTIAGLDWILEQAEDPSSEYYQRLDTNNIGQLGHSYGGMSTCMSASEPRYKALATICGTRALSGVHTPMLFFCGGKDTVVECEGVKNTFLTVTDQPAFFINELEADHGSWVYEGADGVSLSSSAAWFRAHLMGDTESRKFFYGTGCTFCSDNRVQVEQNSLMAQ